MYTAHMHVSPARFPHPITQLTPPCTLHRVYHYSMANYVYILKKGMDVTPGGKDESKVPVDAKLGEEVDLERRVQLLVETTSYTAFAYVAQVRGPAGSSCWVWPEAGGWVYLCSYWLALSHTPFSHHVSVDLTTT